MPNSRSRASRRLKGRLGLPPRAMALVATSFVLLAGSMALYLSELPSLAEVPTAIEGAVAEKNGADVGSTGEGATAGDGPSAANGEGANADKGAANDQDSPTSLPEVSLEEAKLPEATEPDGERTDATKPSPEGDKPADTTDVDDGERPPADTTDADDGERPPSNEKPEPDADEGSQGSVSTPPQESVPSDIFSSTPTAAEEEAFRQFLLNKASLIPGYASRASACAGAFESDGIGADLSTRRAHRGTCAALCQQLYVEYAAVRDYARSNDSKYCDAQSRLIGAYRCLTNYVSCYEAAWDINVSFDDPGAHTSEFSGPLSAASGHLRDFHSYYDGLTI